MLNMTVVCPRCGEQIPIAAESFEATMPIYEEQEMEASETCACGMMVINVRIVLTEEVVDEETEESILHIGNVVVTPVPVVN